MVRRIPSLNALRAFEAAARHGRMTRAAEELNVTHSAVSRQVGHLEDLLGTKLFEGPKNALRLTDAGTALFPALRAAFDQIDMAVRLVADREDGPLDVSCLGTFMMRWLIPRLHRFQEAHPRIDVRLTASHAPVDFAREGFDVAIRSGTGPWPSDAEAALLFHEQVGLVLSPRISDARAAPRLTTRTRPNAWEDWRRRRGEAEDAAAEGPQYEHFYFMLEAATAGLGICIAPWPLVADDVRAGRLAAPQGFVESGIDYVALRRRRRHRKSALFCAWLQEEALRFEAPGA